MNTKQAFDHGRMLGNRVLSEAEVIDIRSSKDHTGAFLAELYSVSLSAIAAIRSGKTWKKLL